MNSSRRAALAVFATALFLRVGYVLHQGPPGPLVNDAAEYRAYASSLVSSGRYESSDGSRATRMPGYPLLLAAIEEFAGPSTRRVQWTQCLLGALTCLFVFFWASGLLRPPWPVFCGLAAACSYDLIAPCSWTGTECLYSFLLAASFCILYLDVPARKRALWGGLGMGLTALTRPEVLPFFALILAASPYLLKGFSRKHAALALAAFLAVGAPWVVRNAVLFHRFVPTSTMASANVYMGLRLPLEQLPPALEPFRRAPQELGEMEREAYYLRAYLELRRATPPLRAAKAYVFNLLSLYYPFLPRYDWTYVLLVPFWIYGLLLARARRDLRPVAGLVVGLTFIFTFLAGPVSRYRFGFAPCLILLAGAGAQGLDERILDKRKFYWAAMGWTAANLAVWLAAGELRHAILRLKAGL